MLYLQKIVCLLLLALTTSTVYATDTPSIAVASNMTHAVTVIAGLFLQETGSQVKLTFGSSGNFARQIVQGAPFGLFLSADARYVEFIREKGIHLLADIEYAHGRIGLYIPDGSLLFDSKALIAAVRKLEQGKYRRLTIPNPAHAPYGVAAQQALQSAGLWVVQKKRLLLAGNAAQAAQISLSGNVDAGIISASYARLPVMKNSGKFFLIPQSWHQPLIQHLVLLGGASEMDRKFFNYMQSKKAREIIQHYGYATISAGNN